MWRTFHEMSEARLNPLPPQEVRRCPWAEDDPLLRAYHGQEWGVPRARWPHTLEDTLMIEGFQSGLSWTINLRKREAFRRAFKSFDPERVSRFNQRTWRDYWKPQHRQIPGQDRGDHRWRPDLSQHAGRRRRFLDLRLGLRRGEGHSERRPRVRGTPLSE